MDITDQPEQPKLIRVTNLNIIDGTVAFVTKESIFEIRNNLYSKRGYFLSEQWTYVYGFGKNECMISNYEK